MTAATGKKKAAPAKRSSSARSSRSIANGKAQPIASPISFRSVFQVLKDHLLGRVLLTILAVAVLIGINFLISFNLMDRFFIAVGIEFILLVLIGWVRFVLRGKVEEDS